MSRTLRLFLIADVVILGLIVAMDYWPAVLYFGAILQDGDYANDFLVDLPAWSAPGIELAGRWLAIMTRRCPPC